MTTSLHERFVALHRGPAPLLLPNAWDAASAALWQELGAAAIATSSAALAWARGYPDDRSFPAGELLAAVRGIARVLRVPLTVDVQDGGSDDPAEVLRTVQPLVQAGAVGINLEDGSGAPDLLVAKIKALRAGLEAPLFINARTDVYLKGLAGSAAGAVALTIERLDLYQRAGADGAFVPGLKTAADAAAVAAGTSLPLSLMTVPGMADIAALQAAGVRRVSVGPASFRVAYTAAQEATRAFLGGDLAGIVAPQPGALDYQALNGLFASIGR